MVDDAQNDEGAREVQEGLGPDAPVPPVFDRPAPEEPIDSIPENIRNQTRAGEHPYLWHEGAKRDHGSTDAVEFIDVKKSFGRNTVLNGLKRRGDERAAGSTGPVPSRPRPAPGSRSARSPCRI